MNTRRVLLLPSDPQKQDSASVFTHQHRNQTQIRTAVDTREQGVQGETVPAEQQIPQREGRSAHSGWLSAEALRCPCASLAGSHRRYATFWELRSEMLPRAWYTLTKAQTTIHCCSFIWTWVTPQAGTWTKSRKTTKPSGWKQNILVPNLSFLLFLPVTEKGAARNTYTIQIDSWFCGWCRHEDFGFYDNGTFFNDYSLLGREPSRRGTGSLGKEMANLVRQALNWRTQQVGTEVAMLIPSHPTG